MTKTCSNDWCSNTFDWKPGTPGRPRKLCLTCGPVVPKPPKP